LKKKLPEIRTGSKLQYVEQKHSGSEMLTIGPITISKEINVIPSKDQFEIGKSLIVEKTIEDKPVVASQTTDPK
jgi:hypothetical protein